MIKNLLKLLLIFLVAVCPVRTFQFDPNSCSDVTFFNADSVPSHPCHFDEGYKNI